METGWLVVRETDVLLLLFSYVVCIVLCCFVCFELIGDSVSAIGQSYFRENSARITLRCIKQKVLGEDFP